MIRKLFLAFLFLPLVLISPLTTSSSPDFFYDNGDAANAHEYGEVWFDATSLGVMGDGEFLLLMVMYGDNIPSDPDYEYLTFFYIDVDLDSESDYRVDIISKGDGSDLYYVVENLDLGTIWTPEAMEVAFEPGGNYLGAKVPYSAFGITSAVTVGVFASSHGFINDDFEHSFPYTIGASNVITIDGSGLDWLAAGVNPYFSDPEEGYVPGEFDVLEFYITDDGGVAGDNANLYHRFNTADLPTAILFPGAMELNRWFWVYYDVDRDGQEDYWVIFDFQLNGSSRSVNGWFYIWNESLSGWEFNHSLDTSGWEWSPFFEAGVPLNQLGVSSGDTIDIRVKGYQLLQPWGYEIENNADVWDPLPQKWGDFQLVDLPAPPSFSSLKDWKLNPGETAIVVGASYPHGPIPRGSLSDDVVGAGSLAGALKTVNAFLDVEAADYAEVSSWDVSWKPDFGYENIVTVGGPFVSLIPYKYRNWLLFPVKAVTEGGHRLTVIDVNKGGIKRCYINQSSGKVIIEHEDETKEEIGEMCTTEEVGTADFAVVEMHYDGDAGKYVAIIFGITRCGSVAASRWVASKIDDLGCLLGTAQGAVLKWQDLDGDGSPEANEVALLATSTSP